MMRSISSTGVIALAALGSFQALGQSQPASSPAALQFGEFRNVLTRLAGPTDVAFLPNGDLAFSEEQAHRVRVLSPAGDQRLEFGRFGRGPGEFDRPRGLAISPDGWFFVVDGGNERVLVFDPTGEYQLSFNGLDPTTGQFCDPHGIAIWQDSVLVADTGNRVVQRFTRAGEFAGVLGGGDGPGALRRPVDVAADATGVFVSDADGHRIVHFDHTGRFIAEWGQWGYFPGLFAEPAGLAVRDGLVYVTDHRNHRVQVFTPDGYRQYEWGLHAIRPREGGGKLHYPDTVAISPDGKLAAVLEHFENRCQIFRLETAEQAKARLNPFPPGSGPPSSHFGEYMDIDGVWMAVTEPDSHSVLIYDVRGAEPINIHKLGGHGTSAGRMIRPVDVDVRQAERLLTVLDAGNGRLQEFDFRITPEDAVEFRPRMSRLVRSARYTALGQRSAEIPAGFAPTAVDRDAAGRFYLLDSARHVVVVLSRELRFERRFGGLGDGPGQLRRPTDLQLDGAGERLYVVDAGNRRVQVFDLAGGGAPQIIAPPAGTPEAFEQPFSLALGPQGELFVTDFARDRIQVFGSGGALRRSWGGLGLGAGAFYRPTTLGFDPRQRLIVNDYGNHRGQIFTAAGDFLDAFGARLFVLPTRSGAPAE